MTVRDQYVAKLEEENDILREKVIRLEEMLGVKITIPLVFGLTAQESKLFGVLLRRELVTKELAMDALYGTRPDGDAEVEIKIVDVYICKARAKLKKFGIPIETVWGRGYRLTNATKEAAKKYLESDSAISAETITN